MQPLPIQSILTNVLNNLDLKRKQEQGKIREFWEKGVGSKIARHTSPHSLTSQGKLLVNVDSSPWVEELTRFHKEKLKKAMNRLLGQELIKEIFFRIGKT